MALTVCTHPARCGDMEAAHAGMAAQLADALTKCDRLAAQLVQAQAAAQEWQDAYAGAVEGKAFYEQLFSERCEQGAI